MTRLIIALSFIAILTTRAADIILPSVYADHMVIQTDQPIVLSGQASGVLGELVIELAGQSATVQPRPFGSWTVTFDPVSEPGGAHSLTFTVEGEVIHTVENITYPRNKQGSAKRLAAIALAKTYGQDRVYSGPLLKAAVTDGHNITLHFDHFGSGLASVDDLAGFEVLTAEGRWSKGNAEIVGDTIEIPGTLFRTNPQGVRYGWDSDPLVRLSNEEGFPACPSASSLWS